MAELALGTISLGLELCKGLYEYIDTARNAENRMSEISQRMKKLEEVLETLQVIIDEHEDSRSGAIAVAGITACAEALKRIDKQLGSAETRHQSSKTRQQVHKFKQRLSYPFKQEDIQFARGMVESIQQNLDTALLVLNVEMQQDMSRKLTHQSIMIESGHMEVLNLQQSHYDNVKSDSANMARMMEWSQEQSTLTRANTEEIRDRLNPMATEISTIADNLPTLQVLMSRLEARLEKFELGTQSINEEISDFSSLGNNFGNINKKINNTRGFKKRCHCRGKSVRSNTVRWPLSFSWTQRSFHDKECTYAVFEETLTDLSVRFSMCSLALRRKAELGIAISFGAGSASIVPALQYQRVVPKSSPAFRLVASFERRLGPDPGLDAWVKPANDLFRLFEKRLASPHDRLPNGQTLLHYFCYKMTKFFLEDAELLVPNYYAMGKRMLEYLPSAAFEKDDQGKTCVDYFYLGTHQDLTKHFMEHGVSISVWRHFDVVLYNQPRLGIQFDDSMSDVLDCSEITRAILLKSENMLLDVINRNQLRQDADENSLPPYQMATRMGWRRGCEILYENEVEIVSNGTLLYAAKRSKDLKMFAFWLEMRQSNELHGDYLEHIGDLEDALDYAADSDQPDWIQAAINTLVYQRKTLQTLLLSHGIPCPTDRLPDAEAWALIQTLEGHGFRVKRNLRPSRQSIYHQKSTLFNTEILELLYTSGFRDITATNPSTKPPAAHPISPLLYLATRNEHYRPKHTLSTLSWLLSKGAPLHDFWPNTPISMLHCLAFRLGYTLSRNSKWAADDLTPYLSSQCTDACKCACSPSGCTFAVQLCKGGAAPTSTPADTQDKVDAQRAARRDWSARLAALQQVFGAAMRAERDVWLAGTLIRFVVFTELGIRHTCCDLARLEHFGEPDLGATFRRGYSEFELEEIREEDEELVEVMEGLVKEMQDRYTRSYVAVDEFMELVLIPRIDVAKEVLKRKDNMLFGEGRRELGVIMGSESEDEEDDLSSEEPGSSDEEDYDDEI